MPVKSRMLDSHGRDPPKRRPLSVQLAAPYDDAGVADAETALPVEARDTLQDDRVDRRRVCAATRLS